MVKWNEKREVIWMMFGWLLLPLVAVIVASLFTIVSFPVLLIIFVAAASGLGYFIFKKRKH